MLCSGMLVLRLTQPQNRSVKRSLKCQSSPSFATVDLLVHGVNLRLILGLQRWSLQLEGGSHESILYAELFRVQVE